jgi:ketosteroid isomerase-like protein
MRARWQKFPCQPSRFNGEGEALAASAAFGHPCGMNRALPVAVVLLVLSVLSRAAEAPDKKQTELLATIARLDSEIFDAFNKHDVAHVMSLFTEDLEFYHDSDGLSHYAENAEGFKKMFASTPDIRRDLEPGSLEVYPIKDYGAMEIGRHRFCHKENGKDDCGTFGFAMVWRKTGDSWKISRVLSYGHQPAK